MVLWSARGGAALEKTCKECGKLFEGMNPSKFCGDECKYKHAVRTGSKAHHGKPKGVMYHGICARCGNAFISERKQKYCKPECDTQAQLDRAKASRLKPGRLCKQCGKELPSTRRVYCSDDCKATFNKGEVRPLTEAIVVERIAERYDSIEYVRGFTGSGCAIVVRCKKCGREIKTTEKATRKTLVLKCMECTTAEKENAKGRMMAMRRMIGALKKRAAILADIESRKRACCVCGKIFVSFNGVVTCSDKCNDERDRDAHRNRKHIRRTVYRDTGDKISLREVYKADNGICYICGNACSYDDYHMRGDYFIVGDTYPSIDHVIPISKHGTHTKSNVRLACCKCNRLKSDKISA